MSSRERVMAALRHEVPDRVPLDLGAMRSTGITALAYRRLKEYLGITQGDIYVYDTGQQLAVVESPVRNLFGVDVVPLDLDQLRGWQPYTLPDGCPARIVAGFTTETAPDGSVYQLEGGRRVRHRPPSGLYFYRIYHPLAEAATPADVEHFPAPGYSDDELTLLRDQARYLYQNTEYAIVGHFGGSVLEAGQDLRGWEQFMVDLARGGPFLEAFLEKLTEVHLANLARYLDAVGPYIQIIVMGDDLGTQHGLQISPQTYRRWIKPCHARIYGYVRQHYPQVYVFLHSCGGIYPLIPDLIEAGVQVLNPVQISAAGMDPVRLKREFGADLTFWGGGCDTQHTLPYGTPAEVAAEVRRLLDIFAPGGGYVFNQVHNIQADVPPENIVAMLETARSWSATPGHQIYSY
ncbi:MAG: methyltransferase [Chloroflexi bacterium]|nr:methyltransferase [Chloroflexota bacterium]